MLSIGIDIGTTSIKGLLFDESANVVEKSVEELETIVYKNCREQNPEVIFQKVINIITVLRKKADSMELGIDFVSLSAYMHSLIAMDADDKPLTNCILWSDGRSIDITEEYKENGVGIEIYKRTGTPIHPMSPLYKIIYLKRNNREIFDNTVKFISIKEYIYRRWTGEYIVDYSIASSSGLFNIHTLKWCNLALEEAGINESHLSAIVDTDTIIPPIKEKYIDLMGLSKETVFVAGASDGCLANLGSRGIEKNIGVVTIGTSGAIRVVTDYPIIDQEGRTFSYILKSGYYVSGGAINNGGVAFDWFNNNFVKDISIMTNIIREAEEGKGPIFLPFLSGERAPYWDSSLRGSFFGLDLGHKTGDLARAVIEGVSYAINDVYQVLEEVVDTISCFYVNGGFTNSNVWVQTLSNALNKKIIVSENYETTVLGAYMLGKLAIKEYDSFSEMAHFLKDGDKYLPELKYVELHQKRFNLYRQLISTNQSLFARFDEIILK